MPLLPGIDTVSGYEDVLFTPMWAIMQHDDFLQPIIMEQQLPLDICMDDVARGSPLPVSTRVTD